MNAETEPIERVPPGWSRVVGAQVFTDGHGIIITGEPDEGHNCDHMGCGSFDHVVWRGKV